MKPINANMLGLLIMELLEGHADACERADLPSLMLEGYETGEITEIENVGGDNTLISVSTDKGGFLIRIEEVSP